MSSVDACTNNPCEGEGQCIEERPGQAKCVCGEGTAGELCESKLDLLQYWSMFAENFFRILFFSDGIILLDLKKLLQ